MKYLTPREMQEAGLLQEVNRQFFHPLGLALAVFCEDELDEENAFRVQLWDERDDPEGWFFAEEQLDPAKAEQVDRLRESKRTVRERFYGSIIQPVTRTRKRQTL